MGLSAAIISDGQGLQMPLSRPSSVLRLQRGARVARRVWAYVATGLSVISKSLRLEIAFAREEPQMIRLAP